MNQPRNLPRSGLGPLVLIAAILGGSVATFAYTAGWLSSQRLTPEKMVEALTPPGGVPPGHRRNHAKGICFTGVFEANGNGVPLSSARVFEQGRYPALGRFNLGTPNPDAADATVRVRGMGLLISSDDGHEWRSAMINPPVFPVSTPQAFHGLLLASASKDPNAMKTFADANPEIAAFSDWAKTAPWTASYAEEPYHSLNSFIFTDGTGGDHAVRWSLLPAAQPDPGHAGRSRKARPEFSGAGNKGAGAYCRCSSAGPWW